MGNPWTKNSADQVAEDEAKKKAAAEAKKGTPEPPVQLGCDGKKRWTQ